MKSIICYLILLFPLMALSQEYQRTWATYFGGNSFWAMDCKMDHAGDLYMVGFVYTNEPAFTYYTDFTTAEAHQTIANGGSEGVIAKFSPQGDLLWCTYLGTEGDDFIYSVAFDSENNAYFNGYTLGNEGIVTLPPDFIVQEFPNSNHKGFLTKFSPDGVQLWGKYTPGVITNFVFDASDQMFAAGVTMYDDIATPGAFDENWVVDPSVTQPSNVFIIKYDALGNKIWGTYYGKAPFSRFVPSNPLTLDNEGNMYISGYNSIGIVGYYETPGCYMPFQAYNSSTFISKFNSSGERLWSTYYSGLTTLGQSSTVISDIAIQDNYLYVTGTTNALGFGTPGVFQEVKAGPTYTEESLHDTQDAFLAKFDLAGNRIWGTYFGGERTDLGGRFSVSNDKIYLSGVTCSTTGIATANAVQPQLSPPVEISANEYNIYDAYIAEFDLNGMSSWSSYYGGGKSEFWNFLTRTVAGNNGTIYLFGNTSSEDNMASENAFQPQLDIGTNANIGTFDFPSAYNFYLARFDSLPLESSEHETSAFQLFPNPNSSQFTIISAAPMYGNITIADMQGRIVLTQQLDGSTSFNVTPPAAFQSGMYLVKLISPLGEVETVKMIVK